ncbi:hypothetical protein K1W54_15780 [Micromonospora sp. CPCC 205371]|nr:hypothetical protein [Micromonospora sp. CPCC 205371]
MLERLASTGAGPAARFAAAVLCRRYRRRHTITGTMVRLMADAQDERISAMAEQALALAWSTDPTAPERIWSALADAPELALRFLLAPAPNCPHVPRFRLVTAPPGGGLVLRTALDGPDPALREAMAGILRSTDHPVLLRDIDDALRSAGSVPSQVLGLALDNPHACRPAPAGRRHTGLAVVAILKDRLDLLDSYDPARLVSRLVRLAGGTFPPPVAEVSRRWLRQLGPGPGREQLCLLAGEGDPEALAAALDSGQEPEIPSVLALFLFQTEQWERYDALDPDGALLKGQAQDLDDAAWDRLVDIALRNGRVEPRLESIAGSGLEPEPPAARGPGIRVF